MENSVSVIMPVYNAAPFVESALASALACPEVGEVIVVNDGSTDGGAEVLAELAAKEARLRLFEHPGGANRGASASRNLGIAKARLPFVSFLDADDQYTPDRFAAEQKVFMEHPEADGVYGAIGSVFHDEDAKARYMGLFGDELVTVRVLVPPEQLFTGLLGGIRGFGHFSIDALTVRRNALVAMDVAFDETLRMHEDTLFLLRLAHGYRLYPGILDRPVALRGVHPANRIIGEARSAVSQHLFCMALERWSRSVRMHRQDRKRIITKLAFWALASRKGGWTRFSALWHLLRHPWLWQKVAVREACIDSILAGFPRVARLMKSLSWRFFRNDLTPV